MAELVAADILKFSEVTCSFLYQDPHPVSPHYLPNCISVEKHFFLFWMVPVQDKAVNLNLSH